MDVGTTVNSLPPWQAAVAVLAASLGAAVLAEVGAVALARRAVARTETELDEGVLEAVRVPFVLTFALVGVYALTRLPAVVAAVPVAPATLESFFGRPALTVVVLLWAWALNDAVNRTVDHLQGSGARYDFAPVVSNVWTLAVLVGALALVLSIWRIDVSPLLAGAGIAGIAVGFAAKDTVANFFGGIALYFDDTYRVGDYVELDSGDAGTVVKVGVRSTTLRTRDEVLVTVPNSVLNASRVINQSAPGRRRRIRVPIGVAYGTDLDEFEALVIGVAEAESLVLDSPRPRMRFRSFGDSALEYELLCWVASPTRNAKATHRLNRGIHDGLREAGIEIPFPRRDVTVRDGAGATAGGTPLGAAGTVPADADPKR
ncbi:mechanosensitive ion channel family protein [Halorarum salinum]|uniref:Mechanosensitive ion channel family protein n=1 Tax=Halorarum salinum TaxID=2743089 RepID=A0A7D5LA94_9EURY|nr:mechanosensitive ion channel family protein [Halobaculum salinum]QLG61631.1 mechanosensitive ion channel family protein [Halobaculum salinum]